MQLASLYPNNRPSFFLLEYAAVQAMSIICLSIHVIIFSTLISLNAGTKNVCGRGTRKEYTSGASNYM